MNILKYNRIIRRKNLMTIEGESKNQFIKVDITLINYRGRLENLMDLRKVLLGNLAHR